MSESRTSGRLLRYGVDAPYVPAILAAVGIVFALTAITGFGAWWMALIGVFFLAQAGLYLYATLRGKHAAWQRLLDGLQLTGAEHVLDIGCGRGAVLLAAAHRLTTGRAHGIDLWRSQDQSGNDEAVTRANAEAEGVSDRVILDTGDMLELPYPDASMDVVVSSLAIHNLGHRDQRREAIVEAYRVLRPGGRLAIADMRSVPRYADTLRELGASDVEVRGLGPGFWFGGPWQATAAVTARKP